LISTDDGRRAGPGDALWRRGVALSERIIGRDWRRVFTLAMGLLGAGVALVASAQSQVWDEVGTGFIGGSVVGLVFAIAQHTLDQQSVERQVADEVRLTVSSTPDLEGIDLVGADLSAVYLWRKRMRYARMDRTRLVGADLRACDLAHASLRDADLRRADLRDATLEAAVLDGADLSDAEVAGGRLTDARLVRATLTGVRLGGLAPSARVDLSGAVLDDARLSGVHLPEVRASFVSARRADATGTVLRGGDLSCADLRGASLTGADLRDADLTGADLRGAMLGRADLRGARLVGARLVRADLTGAEVAGVDLRWADLRGAFLTNVDLRRVTLDGARVGAEDLRRAEAVPDLAGAGVRVEPAGAGRVPASAGAPPAGARAGRGLGRAVGAGRPASGPWPGLGGADRLSLVPAPGPGLDALAVAVAVRLRRRRAGLDRVNGDLESIHLRETHPYAGEPAHHGLPRSVAVRRRPPRRRAWVELRRDDGAVEMVLHRLRAEPVVIREVLPAGDAATDPRLGGRLASTLQHTLADPEVFCDADEIAAFAAWLEQPGAPVGPALDEVLSRNPRNPLALILRAYERESGDTGHMAAAIDEVRVAWSASEFGLLRALAATRLAWSQAQILHRASDTPGALARSRSAGEVALRLFDDVRSERHPSDRIVVLQAKAEVAAAFSEHVTEEQDGMQAGVARYRRCIRTLERHRLPVNPRIRNSIAYCLMAAAGRFTTGPGAGYTEAIDHLRRLLAHYGLREEPVPDVDGSGLGATLAVDERTRRCTVPVAALARRGEAGHGPPGDLSLRERSLRVGLANLGNLYRLEKRFDAALDCYGAAVHCHPGYVEAYAERAWVHLELADREAAVADIGRALAVDTGTPAQKARVLLGYVEALERVGLGEEQGPWLDEAERRDPGNPRLAELRQRWKERAGDESGDEG
jgi:uncharacterized protein YjbI with pentapeptide repeats/tetratricopeptide (TPR) repeat protein